MKPVLGISELEVVHTPTVVTLTEIFASLFPAMMNFKKPREELLQIFDNNEIITNLIDLIKLLDFKSLTIEIEYLFTRTQLSTRINHLSVRPKHKFIFILYLVT